MLVRLNGCRATRWAAPVDAGKVSHQPCPVILIGPGIRDFLEDMSQVVVGFEAAGFGDLDIAV